MNFTKSCKFVFIFKLCTTKPTDISPVYLLTLSKTANPYQDLNSPLLPPYTCQGGWNCFARISIFGPNSIYFDLELPFWLQCRHVTFSGGGGGVRFYSVSLYTEIQHLFTTMDIQDCCSSEVENCEKLSRAPP